VPGSVRAPGLAGLTEPSSMPSPRTSTSSRRSARPWASCFRLSRRVAAHRVPRKTRSTMVALSQPPGSSTGATWAFPAAPSTGPGTGTWNGTTSLCGVLTTGLRPIRRRLVAVLRRRRRPDVAHRSRRTPPGSSGMHSRCSPGEQSTRTGKSRTSFSRTAASAAGRRRHRPLADGDGRSAVGLRRPRGVFPDK